MARRTGRRTVERSRFRDYERVANHFFDAARDAMELGYWTAAGVLIVHSGIAYADALCIQQSGVRSAADDHEEAVALLEQALPPGEEASKHIQHLRRIVEAKTKVSYLGELYSESETRALWTHLDRFRRWARLVLRT